MQGSSVFLIAFFTAIFTAAGTTYVVERLQVIPKQERQAAEAIVPKVDGLTEAEARMQMAAQGLIMLVDGVEAHATAPGGVVIRQSSAPLSRTRRGEVVSVTLAETKPVVPNVVGRTVEEAGRLLDQAGLKLQLGGTKPDDSVPPGQVVAQVPAATTTLAKGQAVTVDVSGGTEAIEIPNVVGLSFKAAKDKLEAQGLVLKTRWVNLAETQTYVALSQEPKAGTKVQKGAEVIITSNRE